MILCDTNILIEFYKNNLPLVQELRHIGSDQLAMSAITQAELRTIKRHLSILHSYPVDTSISNRFLQLMETYSLRHRLSLPDALIAATALEHDLELYTLNIKDFRFILGLRFYQT